jgi:hypothetical protein
MRITAICMILLLASQAGAAIVCPAECAPVASSAIAHHGHEHHMHAASAWATISAAPCDKLMVAESVLGSANRVPEFALDVQVVAGDTVSFEVAVAQVQSSTAAPPSNSPPRFTVLRI